MTSSHAGTLSTGQENNSMRSLNGSGSTTANESDRKECVDVTQEFSNDLARANTVAGVGSKSDGPAQESSVHPVEQEYKDPWTDNFTLFAVVFMLFSFLYGTTAYAEVAPGDSAELMAAAHNVGLGHPPGYPLFILAFKAWSEVFPFGNEAWRMNLFNAFIGSAAAATQACVAARLTRSNAAGFWAGIGFGLAPVVWLFATQAEVFTVNNLLCALLLLSTLRFIDHPSSSLRANMGAFLAGLSLTNQHTAVVFAVPCCLMAGFVGGRTIWQPLRLFLLFVLFCLGVSAYLFMPLATMRSPLVSWGDCHSSWQSFMKHFLREEYGSFRLTADDTPGRLAEGLRFYILELQRQAPFLWPLAFIGIWFAMIPAKRRSGLQHTVRAPRSWASSLFVVFLWVFYVLFFHSLANMELEGRPDNVEIIQRFWMQPGLPFFCLVALAIEQVAHIVGRHRRNAIIASFSAVYLICGIVQSYAWMDQSQNTITMEFGRDLLDPLPTGAIAVVMTDLATNSMRYMQAVKNYRRDVVAMDQNLMSADWFTPLHAKHYPTVVFPGTKYWPSDPAGYDMNTFLNMNWGRSRVFTYPGFKDTSPYDSNWATVPYGYMHEVVRKEGANRPTPWIWNASEWLTSVPDHFPSPPAVLKESEWKYPDGSWENRVRQDYFAVVNRYGQFCMKLAESLPSLALPAAIRVYSNGVIAASMLDKPHWMRIRMNRALGYSCLHAMQMSMDSGSANLDKQSQDSIENDYRECLITAFQRVITDSEDASANGIEIWDNSSTAMAQLELETMSATIKSFQR